MYRPWNSFLFLRVIKGVKELLLLWVIFTTETEIEKYFKCFIKFFKNNNDDAII
jgi:predicted KAP-like P-loop ATPase